VLVHEVAGGLLVTGRDRLGDPVVLVAHGLVKLGGGV
jgi:hypothetical protein